MSNTGPWFGGNTQQGGSEGLPLPQFLQKLWLFSSVPPSPLCPWWSPCLLPPSPSIWQPSCGLPGGYSCSCFRFRSWPMIGNQTETRQVSWTTENRSQNNITIFLLWFPLCPASGNIRLLLEWRLSHAEEHAAIVMGRQGLGMFPLAYCQVTFWRTALDPPLLLERSQSHSHKFVFGHKTN